MDYHQRIARDPIETTHSGLIRTVLLIEDNPGDARLIREMFNAQGRHEVELTHIQQMCEAQRCLAGKLFDIILLDLGLPDAQGLEAVRRTRASSPHVPLVVLSGMDDESMAIQALQEGAQDYLIKGQSEPREMLRALRYAIERKSIEEALFAEKERAQVTLDCIGDAVICTDLTGNITFFNSFAEIMTGWSLQEATGKPMAETFRIVDADSRRTVSNPMRRAVGEDRAARLPSNCILIRRDGVEIAIEDSVAPIHDRGGQITGSVSVFRDVTADRRLRDELRQGQKMEVVGRLAGGVAHDFNNILTGILGFSELLIAGMEEGTEAFCRVLEIKKAGERAAALTQQLLAFSRRQVLRPQIVDLNKVVLDLEELLGRLMGDHIELQNDLGQDLDAIHADPGQMSQIILNLALNARDAMPSGGRLTVQTRNFRVAADEPIRGLEPGDHVSLTITDSGSGMDQETQRHIFEPFFTTKPQGSGTGLGLATVFGIVNQTGGNIHFTSEIGLGTSFFIDFPPFLGIRVLETPQKLVDIPRASETVLLVEDDEMVRELIVAVLSTQGYTVLVASQANEALDLCRSHASRIDLLLTDLLMPGNMDGQQLADKIAGIRMNTRVLLMSGYTKETLLLRGVEEDRGFLQKPFTMQQLSKKVREALEGNAA